MDFLFKGGSEPLQQLLKGLKNTILNENMTNRQRETKIEFSKMGVTDEKKQKYQDLIFFQKFSSARRKKLTEKTN